MTSSPLLIALGAMFLQQTFASVGKVLPAVVAPLVIAEFDADPAWVGVYYGVAAAASRSMLPAIPMPSRLANSWSDRARPGRPASRPKSVATRFAPPALPPISPTAARSSTRRKWRGTRARARPSSMIVRRSASPRTRWREYGFETAIGSFNYSFNFMLAGVPEPASTGLLTGLALLAAVGGFAVRDALRAAPSLVPLKDRGQFEGTRAS